MISDIQSSAGAMMVALDAALKETEADISQILRKTWIDLWDRIKTRTPFKTGRARNGWGVYLGDDPPEKERGEFQISNFSLGTTAWIYNNVVYIERLENGWSKQAPQGMVALSLTEYAHFFAEAAASLGYETI